MLGKHPLISRLTIFVLLPLAAATGLGWLHLQQSLPKVDGRLEAPSLHAIVRIARDARGVPAIIAATDRDAFFAMGFVHAQDRMWQMELQRRLVRGRLSEILGKDSVEPDIWMRTLGLERSARSAWPALSVRARESLQAYADGVNYWLASDPVLPPEFLILGVRPEPWTVYDSIAWIKMFALSLGGNYRREIERLLVSQLLAPAKLHALFPEYPQDAAPTVVGTRGDPFERISRYARASKSIESQWRIGGRYAGSNAWVVSGRLSGGAALLANDPHLGLQIPSLWYMASIKGAGLDVHGATLVGLPLVVFGRNQWIAWGGTNLMADVQDLYVEQVKPDDSSSYNVNGEWTAFDQHQELIRVRQDFPAFLRNPLKPLRINVRSTRHGPVISDVFDVLDQPTALRWTALESGDTSYEAFFRLNYARDWSSFEAALHYLIAPALNMVYADRGGNIGYLGAGRIPIRAKGEGMLPAPGWTHEYEWIGAIPHEQWPRSYNPRRGFLVTANNKPVDEDYPYLITNDWAPSTRANRITFLLEQAVDSGEPLGLDAMRAIQADRRSEPARDLLKLLLRQQPSNEQQGLALAQLARWQGDMTMDSPAATVFNAWMRALRSELLLDQLGEYWNRDRERRYVQDMAESIDTGSIRRILLDERSQWCAAAAGERTCDDMLGASLDVALREVRKLSGDHSVESWRWGDVHHALYQHTPFSQVNVLRGLFERTISTGGSPDSINVANYTLERSGGYWQTFGAGFRQVIAMSAGRVGHLYMNSTGQSGNVMSRNYDDMVAAFRNVEYESMQGEHGPDASVLTLIPAQAHRQGPGR